MKCITLSSIGVAQNCADLDNRGGIAARIILCLLDDVATFPDLPAPSSSDGTMSLETAGAWDGTIAMKNGKKMVEIRFIDGTGEITVAPAGEAGARCAKYGVVCDLSKLDASKFGLMNAIKDQPIVVLAEDKNGVKYLLGDRLCPAKLVDGDGGTTGKESTEVNKLTLNFEYICPRFLTYNGDLDTLLVTAGGSGSGIGE